MHYYPFSVFKMAPIMTLSLDNKSAIYSDKNGGANNRTVNRPQLSRDKKCVRISAYSVYDLSSTVGLLISNVEREF